MEKLLREIDALQKEINTFRPLDKHLLKQIKEYYRIGLTYSTNAIEGNTLTESETKIVLEEGITIHGKRLVDHLEAVGMSSAYDFLYRAYEKKSFTEDTIKRFHKLFYGKINAAQAGKYRKVKVFLTGSKYPLPLPADVPRLMEELIVHSVQHRQHIHPVLFAALAHKELVFIHPFVDGNGRVARLLMNLILLQEGYTLAIIPPVLRAEYIRCLEKAHTDDTDFVRFIAEMVKESQKDYLRLFR